MMKSVTDESQERPNTTSDELSREFIMERVGDVGEGSPFVYDTVVTPMTDDALRSMKAYSDESFGNLSRVFDDLCGHDTGALYTELHSCISVNGIINAAMTRHETTQHLAVCRIDDGIHSQRSNVALPEIYTGTHRRQIPQPYNTALGKVRLQIGVLYG